MFSCSALLLSAAFLAVALLTSLPGATGLDNGLALTPPMGWMAWSRFMCETDSTRFPDHSINERLFFQMADRIASDGYAELGYKYVNIDDCWSKLERHNGRLEANESRFPSGLERLAADLNAKGLKLGIYGDCGLSTCAGYPGLLKTDSNLSKNFFHEDAKTIASWNIHSFKMDGCFNDPLAAEQVCPSMALALNGTGRPILLTCEWPFYKMYAHREADWDEAARSCNTWRYYDDIADSWMSIVNVIEHTVRHQSTMVKYHGPGHWFDPDQLVIGNFGLSQSQQEAQMAIWSIWSAPLFMSNDLRRIRPESVAILMNKRLIDVNQDELGVMGLMVSQTDSGNITAFVKPVMPVQNNCPSFVVVYLNKKNFGNRQKVSFPLRDLLVAAPIYEAQAHQRELWRRRVAGAQQPSDGSGLIGDEIKAGECIKRLKGDSATAYTLTDLIASQPGGKLVVKRLDEQLDLEVKPNGVRAVKLEE